MSALNLKYWESAMLLDNRVFLVRNFITPEECAVLTDWAVAAADTQFVDGVSKDPETGERIRLKTRLTNRLAKNILYPDLVYAIQSRLRETFPLIKDAEVIERHGRDGVVVSITYDGGDVYRHKDPATNDQVPGTVALRFNILASAADSGGLIHVEDATYALNAGDLMAYEVSENFHSVETCSGSSPRIMFMFGFCVPAGTGSQL
jgi:hypothetical protein